MRVAEACTRRQNCKLLLCHLPLLLAHTHTHTHTHTQREIGACNMYTHRLARSAHQLLAPKFCWLSLFFYTFLTNDSTRDCMQASLQETERNRSSTVDHLAQLEASLEKETSRAESAVSDCNTLKAALTTAAEEKHVLCHRIQELSELLKTAKRVMLSTWQQDDDVDACTCGKKFTFSERKHHCRTCGQVYCDTCVSRKVMQASSPKPERLCNTYVLYSPLITFLQFCCSMNRLRIPKTSHSSRPTLSYDV